MTTESMLAMNNSLRECYGIDFTMIIILCERTFLTRVIIGHEIIDDVFPAAEYVQRSTQDR